MTLIILGAIIIIIVVFLCIGFKDQLFGSSSNTPVASRGFFGGTPKDGEAQSTSVIPCASGGSCANVVVAALGILTLGGIYWYWPTILEKFNLMGPGKAYYESNKNVCSNLKGDKQSEKDRKRCEGQIRDAKAAFDENGDDPKLLSTLRTIVDATDKTKLEFDKRTTERNRTAGIISEYNSNLILSSGQRSEIEKTCTVNLDSPTKSTIAAKKKQMKGDWEDMRNYKLELNRVKKNIGVDPYAEAKADILDWFMGWWNKLTYYPQELLSYFTGPIKAFWNGKNTIFGGSAIDQEIYDDLDALMKSHPDAAGIQSFVNGKLNDNAMIVKKSKRGRIGTMPFSRGRHYSEIYDRLKKLGPRTEKYLKHHKGKNECVDHSTLADTSNVTWKDRLRHKFFGGMPMKWSDDKYAVDYCTPESETKMQGVVEDYMKQLKPEQSNSWLGSLTGDTTSGMTDAEKRAVIDKHLEHLGECESTWNGLS